MYVIFSACVCGWLYACGWLDEWGGEDSIQSSFIDAVDCPLDEAGTTNGRKPIQATDPWNMSRPTKTKSEDPERDDWLTFAVLGLRCCG
jgi:hypothetical protein